LVSTGPIESLTGIMRPAAELAMKEVTDSRGMLWMGPRSRPRALTRAAVEQTRCCIQPERLIAEWDQRHLWARACWRDWRSCKTLCLAKRNG